MASAKQQEHMLLTEHFTWPPITLIDDIINAVNEVLYRCTDSFETGLLSADPALLGFADRYAAEQRAPARDGDGGALYPEARLEIEEGVLKLETLMENAVDKNFDKLEIWTLRNVLCLPRGEEELASWVRLGGYENLVHPPKDPGLTPEALYTLRRKLIETQKLNAALVAEKRRNEAQIASLRALLQPPSSSSSSTSTAAPAKPESRISTSPPTTNINTANNPTTQTQTQPPFAFLTHTPAAQNLGIPTLPLPHHPSSSSSSTTSAKESRTPLTTHTTFTTSQLPALRALLSSLRPHLSSSKSTSSTSNTTNTHTQPAPSETDTSHARKIYIESQSKRILEQRGVDTRDGVEGVWDARRVGGEEVRGLEGLVGGLVGRSGDGESAGGDVGMRAEGEGEEEQGGEAMDTS